MQVITKPILDEGSTVIREAGKVRRKRGRPYNTASNIFIVKVNHLTNGDFSFIRANLKGLSLERAAKQYLSDLEHLKPEDLSIYRDSVIERLLSASTILSNHGTDIESSVHNYRQVIENWWQFVKTQRTLEASTLDAVTTDEKTLEVIEPKNSPPSFELFLEKRDWDGFSMDEIIDEFIEEYGVHPDSLKHPPVQQLGKASSKSNSDFHFCNSAQLESVAYAIGILQGSILTMPSGNDLTSTWLAPSLVNSLKLHGVITLRDLANWINLTGKRWFDKVRGVGQTKAQALVKWLINNEIKITVSISPIARTLVEPPLSQLFVSSSNDVRSNQIISSDWDAKTFDIVSLQHLDWPMRYRGHDGAFRSPGINVLGASDDEHAVRLFLDSYKDSPNTQKLYGRAIESLVLWSLHEKQKPLSSLTAADLSTFKEFLINPPAHWVTKTRYKRSSPEWRPFRGPMKASSVQSILRAVSVFFSSLAEHRYLTGNPAHKLVGGRRTDVVLDTMRSLTNQELEVVSKCFKNMPEGVRKNRFKAIILLLQTTGVRKSEARNLTWANVSRARVGNNESNTWLITFTGKGQHERSVPIPISTYEALVQHLSDRRELANGRELSYQRNILDKDMPLIGILNETPAQGRSGSAGDLVSASPAPANTTGHISEMRLHEIIKDFFAHCAVIADQMGVDSSNFLRATPHWMRHTFAHLVLEATGGDLAVTQQLLGHRSIATTGIYTKADMTKRVEAINKLRTL